MTKLFSFGLYSGLGLASDFAVLYVLNVTTELHDWACSALSGLTGTTIVYFLVTRKTWKVPQSILTYSIFIFWYALVIIASSIAIQMMHQNLGISLLEGKAITIPFSFLLNFSFNKLLFSSHLVLKASQDVAGERSHVQENL
jgi:putative flippase GtrA